MNLADLKVILKEAVLDKLDHKNLDVDVEHFHTKPSTVENIAVFVWESLEADVRLPEGLLYEVKVHETDNQYAYYKGEKHLR